MEGLGQDQSIGAGTEDQAQDQTIAGAEIEGHGVFLETELDKNGQIQEVGKEINIKEIKMIMDNLIPEIKI